MKLSRKWLAQYIDIPASSRELDTILTNVGLELEGVEDQAARITGVIVGHVRTCRKHPNADKLSVCEVFDGSALHTVVCGAPNVAEGQSVAFAPVGVHLPAIDLTIGRRTLRGVESAGMICSAAELGLSSDHAGIMILSDDAPAGTPLADHLGMDDATYEIGITPNRGDALSHIGVARDLAAGTGAELRMPAVKSLPAHTISGFTVHNDAVDLCPRYSCASILGLKVVPSPDWMHKQLERAGVRPINILVDVTNFVMLEIGQPMHAFDRAKLHGDSIHVRIAAEGEAFTTLDGREHSLKSGMLLICDAERPVAVAGIMGGRNSEISESTCDVLLESAHFNASSVRRTGKLLGISTESSYRFERGTDPDITIWALQRATELITRYAGGHCDGVIDHYPTSVPRKVITLRPARTEQILGISIPASLQINILRRLQFGIEESGDDLRVSIPTFRNDIEREIDLIEEIARINGYDNIPVPEKIQMHSTRMPDDDTFSSSVRSAFLAMGFDEVMTSSLVSRQAAQQDLAPGVEAVHVLNPVSTERPCLRSSLLPSLLETVGYNIRMGTSDLRIFEIGTIFQRTTSASQDELAAYGEQVHCGALIAGIAERREWFAQERQTDFHDLKGALEALVEKLRLDKKVRFSYDAENTSSEPELTIEADGIFAGRMMQVPDEVLQMHDISVPVVYAEFSMARLSSCSSDAQRYVPVSRFPAVYRDLAVIVPLTIPGNNLLQAIVHASPADLADVRIIDVFTHESIGADRKSIALSLVFQPSDRTLTEQEISERVEHTLSVLIDTCYAELRR